MVFRGTSDIFEGIFLNVKRDYIFQIEVSIVEIYYIFHLAVSLLSSQFYAKHLFKIIQVFFID